MRDFLKWGLIGGGAIYLFFHKQIEAALALDSHPAAAATATGGQAAGTSPPAAAAPPAPPVVATEATTTRGRMLAEAQNDAQYVANGGRLSAFGWGFYYQRARGTQAKDPAELGITDPAMLLSLDEYWTAATRGGMAGIRLAAVPTRRKLTAAWAE